MNKKALFMVGSVYQLMNAISIRITECADTECDLILRSATVWDEDMLSRLKQERIFKRISCPDLTKEEKEFWLLDEETQLQIYNEPLRFLGEYPVDLDYDELYMGVIHNTWRLIYYYQTMNGKHPKVFMFDEGVRAYTLDISQYETAAFLQGNYANTPLIEAIEAYYLLQPELYTIPEYSYELRELCGIKKNPHVRAALLRIFGYEKMPEETYIYLEDYFFADHHISNDFQMFQQFADLVGAENIIVKRHPRCLDDRFTPEGFKTSARAMVPWEIQLMSNDLSSKVLVSVSSTAILSPFMMFDSDMHVISFERMYVGDDLVHKDPGFSVFWEKMIRKINEKESHFHTPRSMEELKETLRYIKLMQMNHERSEVGADA